MTTWSSALSPLIAGLLVIGSAVQPTAAQEVETEPPSGDYQKVSSFIELPDFEPGLGMLYVQPEALPAGPFPER